MVSGFLKIARLALVYGFFTLAVVPPMSEKIGKAVGEMMTQQQQAMGSKVRGTPPTDLLIKTYVIMYSVIGVGMVVVGSIYPGVMMFLLSRPRVKTVFVTKGVNLVGREEL